MPPPVWPGGDTLFLLSKRFERANLSLVALLMIPDRQVDVLMLVSGAER